MRLCPHEVEAGILVKAAGGVEHVVGPLHDPPVAGFTGEADAFVDEARAGAVATRRRLDQEQAQLGHRPGLADEQNRADDLALALGDPAALARGAVASDELRSDVRDQRLEPVVLAIFPGIEHGMAMHDPADVAGAGRTQDESSTRDRSTAEQPVDRLQGADEADLLVGGKWRKEDRCLVLLVLRTAIEGGEGAASFGGQLQQATPAVGARGLPADEATALEAGEDAAQIAGVEPERLAEFARRRPRPVCQFVEHARLGQREGLCGSPSCSTPMRRV